MSRLYDYLTIVCQGKLMQASWTIQSGESLTSRSELNFAYKEVTTYAKPKERRVIFFSTFDNNPRSYILSSSGGYDIPWTSQ